MLGSKLDGNAKLRAPMRGVSRWGTLCGALGLLVFITGCPRPQACTDDAGCDDGLWCNGAETCNAETGMCDAGTAPCTANQECDEDNDTCITVCMTDADCPDDNNPCTDATCGADGVCGNTNDDTNTCTDDNECTDDACVDGTCVSTNNDANTCDDGDECTENDACSAGTCAGTDIADCCTDDTDCDTGEVCNIADGATTGTCETVANTDLEADNPDVDFADLTAGDTVSLVAPDPTATAKRRIFGPRQPPANCTCAWTVDPTTAGTFSAADECTTDFTVDKAGDFTVTVVVTCDSEATTFNQDAAAGCLNAADCDDGIFCNGSEACDTTTGDCTAGAEACPDDGAFCNGTESCDEDTDTCSSSGDPCDTGEVCDEVNDNCGAPCTADTDCDDGLFCNGTETCDTATGSCVLGTDPCPGLECFEATDSCSSGAFRLTTGSDDFTGGAGDDTFDGSLFLTTGGQFVNTINNGDSLVGGAGTDTLSVETTAATTVAPSSLAGIEILNLEHTTGNALTFNAVNADSLTTVNNRNTATNNGTVTVNNVGTTLSNIGWTNGTEAFTVNLTATALSGTSDACTIDINGVVDPGDNGSVLTIQPSSAGSGYETFNITSSGGIDNVVDQITDGNGTTLSTVNITGGVKLTITDELDASVTTVDASATTAGVVVPVNSTGVNTICTGGAGNDTFDFSGAAGDYNTSDTINGGEGTDTLKLDDADAQVATSQSNVTNVEVIEVDTPVGGNIDISFFGATKLKLSGALGANTATIPDGGTVEIDVDPAGNGTIASKSSGVANALTLIMDAGWTGTCDLATWETVNIEANTTAVAFSSTVTLNSSAATETINVTGTQAVTFTGVVTADKIDGSGMTGALTVTATGAGAMTITGGSANDSLDGSDGDDSISGGDGSDTIEGNDGDDVLTGGNNGDTFIFEATAAGNGNDIINDFSTSDILNVSAFAGDNLPAGTLADTSTGNQATADDDVWIITDADGSIDTAAEVAALFGGGGLPFATGTANADVVLIIQDTQTGGSSAIWYVDNDGTAAIVAAECVQVATLSNFNGTIADANIAD